MVTKSSVLILAQMCRWFVFFHFYFYIINKIYSLPIFENDRNASCERGKGYILGHLSVLHDDHLCCSFTAN